MPATPIPGAGTRTGTRFSPVPDGRGIATIRNNLFLAEDGTMTAVFRLRPYDPAVHSEEEGQARDRAWRGALNRLEPAMRLRLIRRVHTGAEELLEEHRQSLRSPHVLARYLAWEREQQVRAQLAAGELLAEDLWLALSYQPRPRRRHRGAGEPTAAFSPATLVSEAAAERMSQARTLFAERLRSFEQALASGGMEAERLGSDQLERLARTLQDAEASPWSKEQWVVPDWRLGRGWVRVGEVYRGVLLLRKLPAEARPHLASLFALLPFPASVVTDAVMISGSEELRQQYEEARGRMVVGGNPFLLAQQQMDSGDPARREADLRVLEYMAAQENLFSFRQAVVVEAESPEQLDERCLAVERALQSMGGAEASRTRDAEKVAEVLALLWPFAPISLEGGKNVPTPAAAALLPVQGGTQRRGRPLALLSNQYGRLVGHDPFPLYLMNRNRLVLGKSGTGKSFLLQALDILPHLAATGSEVILFDSGGSFRALTEAMGGTYARLGGDSSFRINLLQLPEGFYQMQAEERRYVAEAKTRLVMQVLMGVLGPAAEEAEELQEMLAHGLVQVYEKHSAPRLGSLYRELGEIQQEGGGAGEMAGRLRAMLSPYVVDEQGRAGVWARDFDVERSDEMGLAPMLCFDLIEVKKSPERFRALALLVLSWVYDRLQRRDGVERQFIADEAWALLKEQASGRMLEIFFREVRKMGVSPALVGQSVGDLPQVPAGRGIQATTARSYYLAHHRSKENQEALETQRLAPSVAERIFGLSTRSGEWQEVVIQEDGEVVEARVETVPLAYWMLTTAPEDLALRAKYLVTYGEEHGLEPLQVYAILAREFPRGARGGSTGVMTPEEALRYAAEFQERYRRFAALVAQGEPIPHDFK